jgi:hypothetical protein
MNLSIILAPKDKVRSLKVANVCSNEIKFVSDSFLFVCVKSRKLSGLNIHPLYQSCSPNFIKVLSYVSITHISLLFSMDSFVYCNE